MKITDKERLDWLTRATNWDLSRDGSLALRRVELDGNTTSYVRALYPRREIDAAIRAERRKKLGRS